MGTERLSRPIGPPPDPANSGTLRDLSARLRLLRAWAGNPPYQEIADRINALRRSRNIPELVGKVTVYDCFNPAPRRRSLNIELVADIVRALGLDDIYVVRWRHATQAIFEGRVAAAIVETMPRLPLPGDKFTGRHVELELLTKLVEQGNDGRPVLITARIEGMPGVGKTELGIHFAHLLLRRDLFTDVQLFVDLRGYHDDPTKVPYDPVAVRDSFLHDLGVPFEEIYSLTAVQRAERYEREIAGKRVLIILDNAASADQVRPLIPNSPTCLVVITSRRTLEDLDNAAKLDLDVMPIPDAVALLRQFDRWGRVNAEPGAATRLTELCGGLPLDLVIVGAQLASPNKASWTLAEHVHRLESFPRDEGVRPAFASSYHSLPEACRRLFRFLALHPGSDFTADAAAVLAGIALDSAASLLQRLHADHLLQQQHAGRYRFHDLLHAYAARLVRDEDAKSAQWTALNNLLDHYLHNASVATKLLYPAEQDQQVYDEAPNALPVPLNSADGALGWLAEERANLLAAAAHAADNGSSTHTSNLSAALWRYLDSTGHYADAVALHSAAVEAASTNQNPAGEATARNRLGIIYIRIGMYDEAALHLQHALTLAREAGDPAIESRTLTSLGIVEWELGRFDRAADYHQEALGLAREVGSKAGELSALNNLAAVHTHIGSHSNAIESLMQILTLARELGDVDIEAHALANLGVVHWRVGRHSEAADHLQWALGLFRQVDDRSGVAYALNNLGTVYQRTGLYSDALDHHQQALALYREVGDRVDEGYALSNLGRDCRHLGRYREAIDHYQEALSRAREVGDRSLEPEALNGFGEVEQACGRSTEAIAYHREAIAIASDISERYEEARGHAGLGDALYDLGDQIQARDHWNDALALYTGLGVPEANEMRQRLG